MKTQFTVELTFRLTLERDSEQCTDDFGPCEIVNELDYKFTPPTGVALVDEEMTDVKHEGEEP